MRGVDRLAAVSRRYRSTRSSCAQRTTSSVTGGISNRRWSAHAFDAPLFGRAWSVRRPVDRVPRIALNDRRAQMFGPDEPSKVEAMLTSAGSRRRQARPNEEPPQLDPPAAVARTRRFVPCTGKCDAFALGENGASGSRNRGRGSTEWADMEWQQPRALIRCSVRSGSPPPGWASGSRGRRRRAGVQMGQARFPQHGEVR
jgi:hypothetical protein